MHSNSLVFYNFHKYDNKVSFRRRDEHLDRDVNIDEKRNGT